MRVEVETAMTAEIKRDGFKFVLNDNINIASVLIVLSDRIYFNSTKKKGLRNEMKVLLGSSEVIDYYETKHDIIIPVYFVQFHSMHY